MKTFEDIPKKYMVNLKGKEYITHDGLMWLANAKGGILRIWTEITPREGGYFATAYILPELNIDGVKDLAPEAQLEYLKMLSQPYIGHAIADKSNVQGPVATAMERMAETRALNRALRLFLRSGMTTYEELPDAVPDDEPVVEVKQKGIKPDDKTSDFTAPPDKPKSNFGDLAFTTADKVSDEEYSNKQKVMMLQHIGTLRGFSPLTDGNTVRFLKDNGVGLPSELSLDKLNELQKLLAGCMELGPDAEYGGE